MNKLNDLKREKYWCPTCEQNHYTDSNKGKEHFGKPKTILNPKIRRDQKNKKMIPLNELPFWMRNMQGIAEIPYYRDRGQTIEWLSKKFQVSKEIVESVLNNSEEYVDEICGWK